MLTGLKRSNIVFQNVRFFGAQGGLKKHTQADFKKNKDGKFLVTLFKGDGIGPEISDSVIKIFNAAHVPIDWELHQIGQKAVSKDGDLISEEAIASVKANKVALKGPFMTPIGKGFKSLNVTLRRKL